MQIIKMDITPTGQLDVKLREINEEQAEPVETRRDGERLIAPPPDLRGDLQKYEFNDHMK